MKKFLKGLLILVTSVVILLSAFLIIFYVPIMAGMDAKFMCSCVFVAGRTPESVKERELSVFPGLTAAKIEISPTDSSVTATLLGRKGKAIYRRGLGCTLLAEMPETELRAQRIVRPVAPIGDQDTIDWPSGNRLDSKKIAGVNYEKVSAAIDGAFQDKNPGRPIFTHAVIVLYNGEIVGEKYAPGFDYNSRHMGWSMTKSIGNAMIGILVKDGKIKVDDVAPVPEWQRDERNTITINNILQASTGLSWSEGYFSPFSDFHKMFTLSDDKARYAATLNLQHKPGTFFEYSSGSSNILSRLIRNVTGDTAYYQFPYKRLFHKIGMHSAIIEVDASGTFVASSYGWATARDWTRFGLLYLNDGVWNGERILPEGWVSYSTTPAPAAQRQEYGAQIWLNRGNKEKTSDSHFPGLPPDAFVFDGFEENSVVVIPSRKAVIVRLGVTHNADFSLADLVNGALSGLPEM
jgi:CubicO group peptidase (beta-lactamase class C family)